MSVSQPRCLLNGGLGHAPRRVFVALPSGDNVVTFGDGRSTTEDCRGMAVVRLVARIVAINAKSERLFEDIVGN